MTKKVIRVISGAPPSDPETKDQFYKWLDEEHVANLFKFKGMRRATNYRIIKEIDTKFTPEFPGPELFTVMEFDSQKDYEEFEKSPEMADCIQKALAKWGPDIGYKKIWWYMYEPSVDYEG